MMQAPVVERSSRSMIVDVVRGIAIVLVVLEHTNQGVFNRGWWGRPAMGIHLDSAIYSFHMPAFFFASGIFVNASIAKRGPWQFTLTKLKTLIYPYVLWSFIFAGS